MRSFLRYLPPAVAVVVAAACGSDTSTSPASVSAVELSSTASSLQAGTTLQLGAVARDDHGNVIPNQVVTFSTSNAAILTVSSSGVVTSVGPVGSASITASAGAVTSQPLTLSVIAGVASAILPVSGQSQGARLVGTLADSLVARVTDAFGNGVPASTVSWTMTGSGTLSAASTITDSDGRTANAIVLGSAAGPVQVDAAISGAKATFTITAATTIGTLAKVSGDAQTGVIGLPLGDSLAVRFTDQNGAPVVGQTVSWSVGATTVGTTTTDGNGLSRIQFVPSAGSATVVASAAAASSGASFSEAANAPVACDLTVPDASGLHWLNEGATDYSIFYRPVGTVKAVMVFVDFSDAPATASTASYADAIVPDAKAFYAEASYGRMSLDVTVMPTWYRMPNASSTYNMKRGSVTFDVQRTYMAQAIALADADVDFSQYSHVYIVASKGSQIEYSPAFIALPGAGIVADGKEIRHGATLGTDLWDYSPLPNFGAHILAHETGHTFGIPDLYSFQPQSNYYALYTWAGGWDVMSWTVPAFHFFAWHKYKFGWIHSDEMACWDHGTAEVVLAPTEVPGGMKLAMLKLDASHAIVAEVRKATGHDAQAKDEGVLLYRLDATAPTGGTASGGPVTILPSVVGSDSTAIKTVGPLYNATYGLQGGKVSTYSDATTGVTMTIKSVADGSYRIVLSKH